MTHMHLLFQEENKEPNVHLQGSDGQDVATEEGKEPRSGESNVGSIYQSRVSTVFITFALIFRG